MVKERKRRAEQAQQVTVEGASQALLADILTEAGIISPNVGRAAEPKSDTFAAPKHPLVLRKEGVSPVVIGAPHGGKKKPKTLVALATRNNQRGDLYTREMAEALRDHSNGQFTAVVALGRRELVDLNSGNTALPEELLDYYRAYHANITDSIINAGKQHGYAIFVDLHGYKDDKRRVRNSTAFNDAFDDSITNPYYDSMTDTWIWPASTANLVLVQDDLIERGAIYLGTNFGKCVPTPCVEDYTAFQMDLAQAGYKVAPPVGFEEHSMFFGGHSVNFHGHPRRHTFPVLAVQIEVPFSIRENPEKRDRFLGTLNVALQNLSTRMASTVNYHALKGVVVDP